MAAHGRLLGHGAVLLLPPPQRLSRTSDTFSLPPTLAVRVEVAQPQRDWLERRLHDIAGRSGVVVASAADEAAASLHVALDPALPAEGYRLEVASTGIDVRAGDAAGAWHALATLDQWLREPRGDGDLAPARQVPGVVIEDAPDFPVRGVMLDVSRNKVPSLETLRRLIDLFASWKLNHLELYTEHTFAYRGHERIWRGWSPLTAQDLRELDVYCRERFVELVPNQNSFGHLHRWLVHEPYRALAECPDGIEHPFSHEVEPFSLCPTDPRSLDFLEGLYDQLLPCFQSALFHVGLDETFDLGRCRSADACAERGAGRVYLDFLRAVHRLVSARGRRMIFWADMVLEHPELVAELPRDSVATVWGYEGTHPFGAQVAPFAAAGVEVWVCPGTSSWSSLGGRLRNAMENVTRAALEGREGGARGLLVTDWGDHGHLQPLPVSYPGWLAAAAFAWNTSAAERPGELDLAAAVEQHTGLGSGARNVASALLRLGEVYELPGPLPMNSSVLFQLLLRAGETLERPVFRKLTVEGLEAARAALDEVEGALALPAGASDEVRLSAAELRFATDLLRVAVDLGCARLALGTTRPASDLDASLRSALNARVLDLEKQLAETWGRRYRSGGRDASLGFLRRLRAALGDSTVGPKAAGLSLPAVTP